MKSSIIIIFNPIAKKASERKIAKAYDLLKSKGYRVEVLTTRNKGHAENLTIEAIKDNPSLIIAAGGDGTFNEVVNGVAGTEIPMAILPFGTTNVLAKELGVPENVESAIEFALSRTSKAVSLGKISSIYENQLTHHSSPISRYFLLMAGIGFDGETVSRINETVKKISGKGAYIISGFETLMTYNPKEIIIDINGKTCNGYSVIISKVAKYGGNFKITPNARLTDPFFYVCLFKGKRRIDILRYVIGIVVGRHLGYGDVDYIKASQVKVKGDAHIQIDGDYFGKTPADFEVVPNAVMLVF
ncbi:MAG: diacylglycerol kinase family lipid kinase [Nitrospirae bacterium]|nr:diacylglycerol kinase family lipid kinase [Nitrospirota bacterium]